MLCLYMFVQVCRSLVFLFTKVTFDFRVEIADGTIGAFNDGLPSDPLLIKSVLQDIVEKPYWSFRPSNQLGPFDLDKFGGDVTVDCE